MCDAAREVARFVAKRSRQDLETDRLLTLALVKEIEIIGEAAARHSDNARETTGTIPWADVIGMRNRLVHFYFDIDLDRLWDTVQHDLPLLAEALERALSGIDVRSSRPEKA